MAGLVAVAVRVEVCSVLVLMWAATGARDPAGNMRKCLGRPNQKRKARRQSEWIFFAMDLRKIGKIPIKVLHFCVSKPLLLPTKYNDYKNKV